MSKLNQLFSNTQLVVLNREFKSISDKIEHIKNDTELNLDLIDSLLNKKLEKQEDEIKLLSEELKKLRIMMIGLSLIVIILGVLNI